MALTPDFVLAWSLAGIVLSYRTKKLPPHPLVAAMVVILMGPIVWIVGTVMLVLDAMVRRG